MADVSTFVFARTVPEGDALDRIAALAATTTGEEFHTEVLAVLATVPTPPAGQVAARIASHGPCDRDQVHDRHVEATGIVDNGGNLVLAECPGQVSACRNCDDRRCMACVLREWHERCEDDCPSCCTTPMAAPAP